MRQWIVVVGLIVGLVVPGLSGASLIDRGMGMIYDTELGITWLQDTNYAQTSGYDADGGMIWSEAMIWADQLEYGGHSDWRLPNSPTTTQGFIDEGEMGYLYSELGNVLGGPLTNTGPFANIPATAVYWLSAEPLHEGSAWNYEFYRGFQNASSSDFNSWYAWAVRDGDYGPSVSEDQTFTTDYLTLGSEFTFDYWWEMENEPTEGNFDVLFFNGTEWETFGWELNFFGSSDGWQSASFWVPEWAQGLDVQIQFSVFDFGDDTNPTVYLNNIGSNGTAPVPEPTTVILLGTGLIGIAGLRRKRLMK